MLALNTSRRPKYGAGPDSRNPFKLGRHRRQKGGPASLIQGRGQVEDKSEIFGIEVHRHFERSSTRGPPPRRKHHFGRAVKAACEIAPSGHVPPHAILVGGQVHSQA
jgi:hypothetical protein